MIDTVFGLPGDFHILIVDDGSSRRHRRARAPAANPISRTPVPPGKVRQTGPRHRLYRLRWGLERGYDYFFEMDCDFSHHPEDLLRLYAGCKDKGGDLAVGSRYVRGGKLENWPLSRILLSYGASLYVRMITWMPVKDPTAGFVCYTRKVLERIDLDKIRFIGYAFQIEMKFTSAGSASTSWRSPLPSPNQVEGSSKMSKGIRKEAILGVLEMRWRGFFRFVWASRHSCSK